MHLTPEEKDVGKVNFQAAIGSSLARGKFLQQAVRGGVSSGNGLGAMYFDYGSSVGKPVRVGVIGTGDEGGVLIGAINPEFIQVKAIADIRPYSRHRAFHGEHYTSGAAKARPGLMAVYGWKTEDEAHQQVQVYEQYQELIDHAEDDQLEAVIIALPLHLHARAAIAAMKAGLHVLTEKLMAHSVPECKEMARVAARTGLHLATGHQRHYNILYENSVELIRQGLLGDLHYIRAQWHRGNLPGNDSWQQPLPEEAKPHDAQAGQLARELESFQRRLAKAESEKDEKAALLWEKRIAQKLAQISDKQIKDAAREVYGYEDRVIKDGQGRVVYDRPAIEELIRWRLWDRTGGGLMAELGSHQLDAASIFIAAVHGGQKQYPLNVAAAAGRPLFPPDRDVEDHVYCLFEFPAPGYKPNDPVASRKRISVAYASINGNGFGGYGETVFGTVGTLVLEREKDAMLFHTHHTGEKTKLVWDEDSGEAKLQVDEQGKGDARSTAVGAMATVEAERGYTEELEHWAWCIRNPDPQNQPRCHPRVALADAVVALTTNMAAETGRRVDFKREWFEVDDDATPERDVLGKDVAPDVSRYGA